MPSGYEPIHGSAPPRRRKTSKKRKDMGDRDVANTYDATKVKLAKGPKSLAKGKGKKLKKLNPKFVKAVKQVFDSKQIYGTSHRYFAGNWRTAISENQQGFLNLATVLKTGYGDCFFTPFDIVRQSIWMFGPDTLAPPEIQVKTLPYGVGEGTGNAASGFKVNVINSYLKVNMMNNSSRTFIVDVYDCAPKNRGQAISTSFGTDNANVTSNSLIQLPLVQWAQKVNDAQNNDFLNNEYLREQYNNKPFEIVGMSTEWSHSLTRFVIGPGQKENFFIQGPKNMDFDWHKSFKNGQFCDIDKYVKCPLIFMRCENLTSSDNNTLSGIPGYSPVIGAEGTKDPLLEFLGEVYYKLRMPEQTFGQLSIAGTPVTGDIAATRRRGPVLRKAHYYDAGVGNNGLTTLPNNPIQDKTQN